MSKLDNMKRILKKLLVNGAYEKCQSLYGKVRMLFFGVRRRLHESCGSFKHSRMSLNEIDEKLAPYLNFEGGFFIEAGANDGVSQSNTYFLEKALGWRGVLVEPVPRLFKKCRRNRRNSAVFNCALVAPEDEGTAVSICDMGDRGLLSRISAGDISSAGSVTEICGRTLTSVLSESQVERIDFFSLDVEGYELAVLKGLDLSRFAPCFILVETAQVEKVDESLFPRYERVAQLTHHDYLYRSKTIK